MFRKNKKDRVLENEAGKSECKQDLRALRKLGVMEDADVQAMLRGTSMVKVRSASWQKSRLLRLLEDGMTVWLESKKRLRRAAAQQTFSVLEVDCVREGCQSEALRGLEGSAPEQQCFTVVFRGGKRKSLDLRGGSSEEVQCWVRGLRKLQERALSMSQRDKLEHWIYGYLRRADLNKDGKMSYEEVRSLLKMINIELNEQYARCLFKQCDRSANGRLENSEIAEFCRRLMRRPELEAVFWKYSGNDSALSAEELREFLQDQGEEQATLAHAHTIIQTYELSNRAKKSQFMTMDGFTMYLLSSESNVFNPAHAPVSQDMTQPLAHYFISASHNTYLTKDQITSMSSTEPYIRALNQGCRCVELDCWDGDKGEPVICHGHTLTSKIPFREVIQTIAQYAFKASPYPLILSLENHCTVEQQAVMAKHLRTLLGDSLVTKPINGQLSSSLPSPEELKGRILVKGKKETGQQVKTDSAGSSSGSEDEMVGGPRSNKNKEVAKAPSVANGNKQAGTSKLSPELSDLVVYCRSTPFRGFEQAAQLPNEMSSFSESEAQRHIKESGTAFVQHNTRQLSRIYPSGQRIQSSNYNPQDMWNCGCQIVALNFQTPGEQMDLNQGRFLANGRCGYILKPAFLRAENSTFDPENPLQGQGYQPTQLTIKVISAQQLPKLNTDKPNSIVDPLVRIEVHGVSSDNAKEETPYITNNGFNPLWNCTLSFKIQVPELALIRFVVEDHDLASSNDFVGQFTLPFTSLRRGFRHVHLLKEDGCSLSPATLFIHVKVSTLGSTKPVSP